MSACRSRFSRFSNKTKPRRHGPRLGTNFAFYINKEYAKPSSTHAEGGVDSSAWHILNHNLLFDYQPRYAGFFSCGRILFQNARFCCFVYFFIGTPKQSRGLLTFSSFNKFANLLCCIGNRVLMTRVLNTPLGGLAQCFFG